MPEPELKSKRSEGEGAIRQPSRNRARPDRGYRLNIDTTRSTRRERRDASRPAGTLVRFSPAHFEAFNPTGALNFDVAGLLDALGPLCETPTAP